MDSVNKSPSAKTSASSSTGSGVNLDQAKQLAKSGGLIIIGALVPILLWIGLAPLSMAVVAPAFVNVDLNRRPVQHLEGGIVREVLVRNGQHIKAGDPILVLGDVSVDADRNRLDYRILLERAGLARLEAEQARQSTLQFSDDLLAAAGRDDRVQQALSKEKALFAARRDALESELALLKLQRQRVGEEATALRSQIAQISSSLVLQQRDLEMNRGLLKDGFISTNRLGQIEATVIDYASKLEERRSEIARAGQRLGDIELKMRSIQNTYMQTASDQLKVAAARLGEIEQEMRKTQDAAARQTVTAPASGEVIDLKFTSPGAVVRAGEPIAEIVPSDAKLMIEARIRPEEVNHVSLGQRTRIKFTSFKYRNSSMISGEVTYVSADRLVDRANNLPYFSVMILADATSLDEVRELKLQAGMPAEVYIEGTSQTTLEYLATPVTTTLRRAAREM